jgi:hypothetical protein
MAGAFVAVADDASAVYWNPAGLATGTFASVVVDFQAHESGVAADDRDAPAVRGYGTLLAAGVPVIGFGYYRLDEVWLGPIEERVVGPAGQVELARSSESLLTEHFAVTLAQTLAEGLHVGVALKAVRGAASTGGFASPPGREGWLSDAGRFDDAATWMGSAETAFDVDAGVMYDRRRWRVGLTVRNLLEPEFTSHTPNVDVPLERQARAGVAFLPTSRVTVAVDADVTTTTRPSERSWDGPDARSGRWRALAAGTEVWTPGRRLGVRGGLRVQTVDGTRPAGSVGGTVVVWKGVGVDGQFTGAGDGGRGWSLGARFTY